MSAWWMYSSTSAGSSTQSISSTDALCEGPIYGLVNGEGSVYLNDNPAMNAEFYSFSPFKTEQIGSQTSGTITFSGGTIGQVDVNTFLPTDITVSSSIPRTLYLLDETAGVGNVAVTLGTPVDSGDKYSIALTSSGLFTNYHRTSYADNVSHLITNDQEINGSFTFTTSSNGTFRWNKAGPIIGQSVSQYLSVHPIRSSWRFFHVSPESDPLQGFMQVWSPSLLQTRPARS